MIRKSMALSAMAFALIACDETNTQETNVTPAVVDKEKKSVTIDATSREQAAYLNLDSGAAVSASDTWHIKFQFNKASTADHVTAAIGDDQSEWYLDGEPIKDAFVSGSADAEAQALEIIYDKPTVVANQFVPVIDNSWYIYNPNHMLTPNSDAIWYVKSNDGRSLNKIWVSAIDNPARTMTLSYQNVNGDTLGAEQTADFVAGEPGVASCFDFEADQAVECSSAEWDFSSEVAASGRGYVLRTNGGESGPAAGGAYGPLTQAEVAQLPLSSLASPYIWSTDRTKGLFDEYPAYEYGVNGGHVLWPNFRTYVITTASATYNVQVTSFYDAADTVGHVTLAYKAVK